MNAPRRKERLVALIALATTLFTPPLLLIADRLEGGLPLYLFLAWGIVIAMMACLMEDRRGE
ncbi:hypothetical protein [Halomonas caseinilytica]|uniref:hypothetical protein n=1 Tax=Halomonas caseinilytica TaxID=438744 RepID=UPI0007E545EB|nr:hypothetical protein [Halomonas caseinilytica]SEM18312.1 hypothetical protein SAMN04487952_10244 [Halomonas caseinilytica]